MNAFLAFRGRQLKQLWRGTRTISSMAELDARVGPIRCCRGFDAIVWVCTTVGEVC